MSISIASNAPLGVTHEERLQRALAGDESAFRWIVETYSSEGMRLRMYLVDLPEGMSVRTLAITVVAPEERFEESIEETAPIIESIEFHPRVGTTSPSEVP